MGAPLLMNLTVHFIKLQYCYVIRHLLILSTLYAYSKDRPNLEINMDNFILNKTIKKFQKRKNLVIYSELMYILFKSY